MTRFVPVTVLVIVLAASRAASAQATGGGTLPNSAAIVFEHRQIFDGKKFIEPQAGSADLLQYFNLAHCNCAKANVGMPNTVGTFNYLIRETVLSGLHFGVDFWAGTSCDDPAHRTGGSAPTCTQLSSTSDIDANLYPGGVYKNFNLYQVVNANQTTVDCLQLDNANNSIFALVDTKGGATNYDYSASQVAGQLTGETTTGSGVDTKPPPLPTSISASPGEGGINISWKPPTANNTDIAYYQALCATLDGSPARARVASPRYTTTQSICPGITPPATETPSKTVLDNSESGEMAIEAPPTGAFGTLDANYICGEANTSTASSLSISGLDNGTPYQVILLAIDLHGNFAATYFDHTITPIPVTDFWEDLHGRGSKTEGGLCLLAETYGDDSSLTNTLRAFRDDTLGGSSAGRWLSDAYYATLGKLGVYVHGSVVLRLIAAVVLAPLVLLALLWHGVTLPGVIAVIALVWLWRRRRRAVPLQIVRVAAVAVMAIIGLAPGRAHAGGYQPYWENSDTADEQNQAAADEPSLITWHAGIRLGPYIPEIDKQFGTNPGPYQQMFGGARVLPMLDVDRILWRGFGQLGVGGSAGYMQKSAHTFTMDSSPSDDPRARASDTNKFRLIPMAVTATYRFTWLDDEYGIPVVPYVRGGLAYYLWWVNTANGSLAKVCKDGGMEPSCSQNKALGGSLGVQGSIGLAIRAERVDASAAVSMRQSGIQHAGIYGELSLAKVDGFGSDKKLSVGDRTWFAGVDFEF
jgi:hypothetical protein